jgi:2-polyprenyl-3-methyl-5-hydroxy-6-metoxy-1,4-benzoquinol methylase
MSYYRDQLENFLKNLSVKADFVIDLGGIQKPVKGRTKTWDVKDCVILDLPDYNMDEIFTYKSQADVLFCLEVFEYLIVPTNGMKNIANLLKPNGVAYASFPLIYPLHNEVEFDSLRYTSSGITRLAKHAGLKVRHLHPRRAKTKTLVQYYQEDGMKMAKGHEHHITGYIAEITK